MPIRCKRYLTGARHLSEINTPTGFPVVLKLSAESAATEGDGGVGSAHGPEHAGLFESRPNGRFAPGFDHP